MVEKIEVRTTSGGFIGVTRCEEGVVWVDIKRGDGTTSIGARLDGNGPTDLAAALDPDMSALAETGRVGWEPRALHAEKLLKEARESAGHGAYQKLNDELAKTKAQVASLQGQVTGRGAALETWKREAELRAEDHERVNAVAKVLGCPSYDVVRKAEILVEAYTEARAREADGDTRVVNTSETWKERDARHRETIHQLKQENANLRGKVEKLILANADRARPHYVEVSPVNPPVGPVEAAHVMSLTKQLEDAQTMHRFCDSRRDGWIQTCQTWKAKYDKQCAKVEELEKAGKILAEAMQEWRSKLTAECGFTYPNLVNLSDILKEIRLRTNTFEKTQPVKHERDDLQAKVDTWRKELTELLEFPSPTYFDQFVTKIRELKALASVSVQLRKDFEDKHRELAVANSEYNRMLELRRGDQETVKRCSDRVKLLETRKLNAIEVLRGARTGDT